MKDLFGKMIGVNSEASIMFVPTCDVKAGCNPDFPGDPDWDGWATFYCYDSGSGLLPMS